MVRNLIIAAVALVVLYFGWSYYSNSRNSRSLSNGDVFGQDSSDKKAVIADDAPKPAQPSSSAPMQTSIAAMQPTTSVAQTTSYPAPATDTQAPNAPNGLKISGGGKYLVYRQGNLTYRVDTSNGHQCILFATDEEWRKPRVYRDGCGKR